MTVHGNYEIRSRREVTVNRSYPDSSGRRYVTHWCLNAGLDEHGGSGSEQRLFVALCVGPLIADGLFRSLIDGAHCFISSLKTFA
jgi:hypothetical protein